MRCPNCNKFVPFDTEVEPEEESQEVDDMTFKASYRRVLQCGECGEDLKEATLEVEYDFSKDVQDEEEEGKPKQHEHEFEIESCEVEPTTGAVTKDRNGRTIRSSRYMKTLYGVKCSVEVKCGVEGCEAQASFDCEQDEQASAFEELS
jgi:hypothetical protein